MKKLIVSGIIAISCIFSTAFAFSWSGLVTNSSKLSANDDFSRLGLVQSNGIYLSMGSNLNETGTLRIVGEGLYRYNLDVDFDSKDSDFQNIADLDLLKLAGEWSAGSGALSMNLGRFKYEDFSGAVFNQLSDGLYLGYDSLKFKVSLYGGCTGLLNRLNVSMVENEYKEDDDFYALCPMYIPVTLDFSYKALFESNTIGLQGACFIPVSDDYKMKAYGTLIMNGFFGTYVSYDARVTAGLKEFKDLMLDAKLDANFYILKNFMLTAGGEYVSGAQGDIKPFETLTTRSFGNAPFVNGVIVPKLAVLCATKNLYAGLTERVILSMPEEDLSLDGFDTSLNVVYNLLSDVQIGCDAGAYICTEAKEKSNYYGTIKASLAF